MVKRAIISAASVFGIKPGDRKWTAALTNLKGTFERTGWELGGYVAMLVVVSGIIANFALLGIREYRQTGWTMGAQFLFAYSLGMSCLLYFLVSRAGLRYVFGAGTVSAYDTWGQLLWSEDLAGIKDVTFFSFRGSNSMTLFWADRKRALTLMNSLKSAIDQ